MGHFELGKQAHKNLLQVISSRTSEGTIRLLQTYIKCCFFKKLWSDIAMSCKFFSIKVISLPKFDQLIRELLTEISQTAPLVWLSLSIFAAVLFIFHIFFKACGGSWALHWHRSWSQAQGLPAGGVYVLRRVTKRWAEISLRLHLVLDSEKEVDLPTEPSSQWMSDRQFIRRTRAHKVVLLESPSQPSDVPEAWCSQIRVRPLPI